MAIATRSGIPTTYAGTNFRSRLEARWSAFFDLVDWPWVYEPFDADGYIPDFLVQGAAPFLVEVGPCVREQDYRDKAAKALKAFPKLLIDEDLEYGDPRALPEHVALVVGAQPFLNEGHWTDTPIAGYLTDDAWGSGPDFARFAVCRACGRIGVHHQSGSYLLHPCGHQDGMRLAGPIKEVVLEAYWAEAGNNVQWRPSRFRRR